jgi:NTP pyrophosphatase (non-canonical NTP hydrolase)
MYQNLNKERNKMNHFKLIEQWAEDRNLIKGATRDAQMVKLIEEVGEVASAIAKGKEDEVMKEIGDAMVVLTILAAQSDIKIEDCLDAVWNKIKDRKGKLINGKFVKEEDLPENEQ